MHTLKDVQDFVAFLDKLPRVRELMPAGAVAILNTLNEDDGDERVTLAQLRGVVRAFEGLPATTRRMLLNGWEAPPASGFSHEFVEALYSSETIEPLMYLRAVPQRGPYGGTRIEVTHDFGFPPLQGEVNRVRVEIVAGTSQAHALRVLRRILDTVENQWDYCLAVAQTDFRFAEIGAGAPPVRAGAPPVRAGAGANKNGTSQEPFAAQRGSRISGKALAATAAFQGSV
jgi:hypothetical protein